MADDKKDKELIAQLDMLMSAFWNSTVSMDVVADDCKVVKGEALYDRVGKCEAAIVEWEKDLNGLKGDLADTKKLLDAYPQKLGNQASGLGQTSYNLAFAQHDRMRASLAKVREDLKKQKEALRKVKA